MADDLSVPSLTAAQPARLTALAAALVRHREGARHVGYRQAEEDCERLAAGLLEVVGRQELEGFVFTPIPRGGLIVLGMLSYLLDLDPRRLAADPAAPRVLVDDCALTGARLAAALGADPRRETVFAHLYSHPDLRRAIEEREPRVRAIAARDLGSRPPPAGEQDGGEEAWRRQWHRRTGGERYWFGRPQPISFAWSEPELSFWNPASERIETGWRFVPPHRCLKNRSLLGPPPLRGRPPSAPGWRVPEEAVWGEFDGILWLSARGAVYSLDGAGAETWRLLARGGDLDTVAATVAAGYRVDPVTARRDVAELARELERTGLLERTAPGDGDG